MAKQTNSFFDFDMTRFLSDLRLPAMGVQAGQLPQIPGVNVDAMVDAQKRNMETLTAANKLAFDGFQAILRRQGEIVRSAMEEASDVAGRMASTTDPQKRMAFQAEVAKEAFERAVANARELTELATNSNAEVLDLLTGRISESLDELTEVLRKQPVGDAAIRATVAESAAAPSEAKAKANGSAVKAAAAPAAKPTVAAATAAAK
ncbi:MAG: phasin family protein [Rhodospirillaceae bacterium]